MSSNKRNLKPQEPGAAIDENQMPEQADEEQTENPTNEASEPDGLTPEASEPDGLTPEASEPDGLTPELKAYIAQQVAEGVKAGVHAQRREDMLAKRNAGKASELNLPSQAEALKQAEKTKRAVLSKDGWVSPTDPEDVRRAGNLAR